MAPGLTDHDAPGPPVVDLSPEARRKEAVRRRTLHQRVATEFGAGTRAREVVKRVLVGAYNDGFIHAGNLAYMSVLAIFPFFITAAAIFSILGEESERALTINTILLALPPMVAEVIRPVAIGVPRQN